jgi:CHAT domain-containing protein/tetratricopeptide (TPR) repeat protein
MVNRQRAMTCSPKSPMTHHSGAPGDLRSHQRTGTRMVAVLVAGCVVIAPTRGSTQPASDATAEAARLDASVDRLATDVEGKFRDAAPLAAQSLTLRERALGQSHQDLVISLDKLAEVNSAQGNHAEARRLLTRALEITERAVGKMHPDVATVLTKLALIERAYARAEVHHLRALDIRERARGPAHREFIESLDNLISLYKGAREYAKAERLALRGLRIKESLLGPMHIEVAKYLADLDWIYWYQGNPVKGAPLALRALDIRRRALTATHPDLAISLNNAAVNFEAIGELATAEALLTDALAVNDKLLDAGPGTAIVLRNFAWIHAERGNPAKGEPLLLRALEISEQSRRTPSLSVVHDLDSLASLYRALGTPEKAEPLLLRARDIREKVVGKWHEIMESGPGELAALYYAQGAYSRAEPLITRALGAYERFTNRPNKDRALCLNALAAVYLAQGDPARAEPALVAALDAGRKALGASHPYVVTFLENLAVLYEARGAYQQAETVLAQAAELQDLRLQPGFAKISAARQGVLSRRLLGQTENIVSLQSDMMPWSAAAVELALTTVLRRKGSSIDAFAGNVATLRVRLAPALRADFDALVATSTALANPWNGRRRGTIRNSTALRARIDELTATLGAAGADLQLRSTPATIADVQAAIPPGAALVEFVHYHRFDARSSPPWREPRYVAYVLASHGPARAISLGEAAPIDAAVDALLAVMRQRSDLEAATAVLRQLDDLVLAPLRGALTGVTHVILSPDGKLNLIPFDALVDANGSHALEHTVMTYVSSGRDLLRHATQPPRSSSVIVAAPEYGKPPSATMASALHPASRGLAEVTMLTAYLSNARILIGEGATKATLAGTIGPALVHLATQGVRGPAAPPARAPQVLYREQVAFSALPPPPSEDPADALDHTGLALAGANAGPEGIATARDLASYDWRGTQLVVLSSGLTDASPSASGDGVHALRRALVLAGTEAQVIALWPAREPASHALMRAFYDELARGAARAEALRNAKLRLLRQPRFAHPADWAAFLLAGNGSAIDAHILRPVESRP